ncbi:MAG TPA: carbohydrate porin [Pirellulaceae bacterium]|jgi:porin|nr:carbohydrate porin [Pirellulaceae bacterium]
MSRTIRILLLAASLPALAGSSAVVRGAEIGGAFVRAEAEANPVFAPEPAPVAVPPVPPSVPNASRLGASACEFCGRRDCFGYCRSAVAPPGDGIWERSTLGGEWCGVRPALADTGVTLRTDLTQFYYGVSSGGRDREYRYAGHGDYVALLDGERLLGWQGFGIQLRAEHRWGESLAGATGALLPSNVLADLPTRVGENVYLTNVLLTQAVSENVAIYGGKLDTMDGDQNAFASGRGKTQFSNIGFVVNPVTLRTVPYSTLGAGAIFLHEGESIGRVGVLNALDTTRSTGFGKLFTEGAVVVAEGRLPTHLFDMPGHQLLGGTWSSRDFVALDNDPRIVLPGTPINQQSGSWSLYWNCDQHLVTYDENGSRGWGVFGRAGLADEQANPVAWFVSGGIGGNSPIHRREADTFGAGWFYAGASSELSPALASAIGPVGDAQAVELFYNVQVAPWMQITPDFQVVMPAASAVDPSIVTGVRANVAF